MQITGHDAAFGWEFNTKIPVLSELFAIAGIAYKRYKRYKAVRGFWDYYLESFVNNNTQGIFGSRYGISRYDKYAVCKLLYPSYLAVLKLFNPKINKTKIVPEIEADKNSHLILFGGSEPSTIAEGLLSKHSARYSFGLLSGKHDVDYSPSQEKRRKIRDEPQSGISGRSR